MKQPSDMLCEIMFKDHKLGVISSRIGKINGSQFTDLSTNSKSFIKFNESYNSPILKMVIQQIFIYHDENKISIKKRDSINIKYFNSQKTGERS